MNSGMTLNPEKSITFTREKKLKTQPVFVIINLHSVVPVPILYIAWSRVTLHMPTKTYTLNK